MIQIILVWFGLVSEETLSRFNHVFAESLHGM